MSLELGSLELLRQLYSAVRSLGSFYLIGPEWGFDPHGPRRLPEFQALLLSSRNKMEKKEKKKSWSSHF